MRDRSLFIWEYTMTMDEILGEIKAERERQVNLAMAGDTESFDRTNSRNDWVAYIAAYSGRAAEKTFRNKREGQDFRANMLKAAALAVAAIEAHDKGYC